MRAICCQYQQGQMASFYQQVQAKSSLPVPDVQQCDWLTQLFCHAQTEVGC
jgi:hypothetical protein